MQVITITVREYAELYGCSPRYVNQALNNGWFLHAMVNVRKSGGTWLIDVLRTWYDNELVNKSKLQTK